MAETRVTRRTAGRLGGAKVEEDPEAGKQQPKAEEIRKGPASVRPRRGKADLSSPPEGSPTKATRSSSRLASPPTERQPEAGRARQPLPTGEKREGRAPGKSPRPVAPKRKAAEEVSPRSPTAGAQPSARSKRGKPESLALVPGSPTNRSPSKLSASPTLQQEKRRPVSLSLCLCHILWSRCLQISPTTTPLEPQRGEHPTHLESSCQEGPRTFP